MRRLCFTLDVLTDGSECTGHGTLFLSVWKQPKDSQNDNKLNWLQEEMKMSAPSARYAISGLGDATARLCADQRLKLAPTRAVFLPTRDYCADGLAALFLALHSAGAPSLHVVTSVDDDAMMEALAGITLGFHRHMNIMTCHVPKTTLGTSKRQEYLFREACPALRTTGVWTYFNFRSRHAAVGP
jgi:hypothetical protein